MSEKLTQAELDAEIKQTFLAIQQAPTLDVQKVLKIKLKNLKALKDLISESPKEKGK